jgi:hypothetical protein
MVFTIYGQCKWDFAYFFFSYLGVNNVPVEDVNLDSRQRGDDSLDGYDWEVVAR